jgi:hypothetical protein
MEVDQPQIVKVETFAGKIIFRVSSTITDEELKKQIQEKMKTESKVNKHIFYFKFNYFKINQLYLLYELLRIYVINLL